MDIDYPILTQWNASASRASVIAWHTPSRLAPPGVVVRLHSSSVRWPGIAIALVLTGVALAGCGGSQPSEADQDKGRLEGRLLHRDYKREEATAEKRAREIGYNHRETEDFATGWLVCSGESKSEFAGEMGLPADAGDADIAHLYASEWPAKDVEAIYAGCMYGLARTPAHFPASSPSAEELWEREFVAISVTGRGGRQPPVHQPPEIKLGFGSEQAHNVGWTARCNDFGADARVTATRIEVEPAFGTEIGCPGGQEREDEWLLRFMDSDPEWRLDGNKLTLTSNRAQIEWEGQRGSD